jgi:hypothetical protein
MHSAVVIRDGTQTPTLAAASQTLTPCELVSFFYSPDCRAAEQGMDAHRLSQACQLLTCQYLYFVLKIFANKKKRKKISSQDVFLD